MLGVGRREHEYPLLVLWGVAGVKSQGGLTCSNFTVCELIAYNLNRYICSINVSTMVQQCSFRHKVSKVRGRGRESGSHYTLQFDNILARVTWLQQPSSMWSIKAVSRDNTSNSWEPLLIGSFCCILVFLHLALKGLDMRYVMCNIHITLEIYPTHIPWSIGGLNKCNGPRNAQQTSHAINAFTCV